MGVRVAHTMVGRTIDYIELDEGFVLIETTAPSEMAGKTLQEAGIRSKHHVTVVCVKRPGGKFNYATPETVVHEGDYVLIAGDIKQAEAFAAIE
jgi:trk system potassium uptake protein TrkA